VREIKRERERVQKYNISVSALKIIIPFFLILSRIRIFLAWIVFYIGIAVSMRHLCRNITTIWYHRCLIGVSVEKFP
jgi:hypothetical protein